MKLNNRNGQMIIVLSVLVSVVFAIFVFSLFFMTKMNSKVTLHDRLTSRAIEVCDVGISQMVGDIHRHNINLALLPYTTYYSIVKYPESGDTENVQVSLSVVPDSLDLDGDGNTTEPETDLEGNNVYQVDSISWASVSTGEKIVRRHVAARVSIVNLCNFNLFMVQNDVWANNSTLNSGTPIMLDGAYHTNGNLDLGGVIYFNNEHLPLNTGTNNNPGAVNNPAYSQNYTIMSAGQMLQRGGYPTNHTFTQNNQNGLLSPNIGFNVCANASRPRGTWFDQAHGGYTIHLESLDFTRYRSMSQVKIDQADLPNFYVNGVNCSSGNLQLDNGTGTQVVDIDLSYLGTGTDKDLCQGMANYQAALSSTYGLIIFVKGPIAVHGQLAQCPAANNNKKVTIITTNTVDIIGDILFSGDPYMQMIDSFGSAADINAWTMVTDQASATVAQDTTAGDFANPSFKNLDSSCMKVSTLRTGGATRSVTLKRHFSVVPPPAGINNNKFFFNIKSDPGDNASVTLKLKDSFNNVIGTVGPIAITSTWKRIALVSDRPSNTLDLSDVTDFNSNAGTNLEIIFTGFDTNWRHFYVDELGFTFGKSYPVDPNITNPTNDAIALISQDNIYENAYYLYDNNVNSPYFDSGRYFAVNGDYAGSGGDAYMDLRFDTFLYTALDNTMFTVHTPQWLDMFSQYGATTSHIGGTVRAHSFNNVFDRNLPSNVSQAIPVGTVIHTYQQLREAQ